MSKPHAAIHCQVTTVIVRYPTKRTGSLPCRIWFLRKSTHRIAGTRRTWSYTAMVEGRVGTVTARVTTNVPTNCTESAFAARLRKARTAAAENRHRARRLPTRLPKRKRVRGGSLYLRYSNRVRIQVADQPGKIASLTTKRKAIVPTKKSKNDLRVFQSLTAHSARKTAGSDIS